MEKNAGERAMEKVAAVIGKCEWTEAGQVKALMEISQIIGGWQMERLQDTE